LEVNARPHNVSRSTRRTSTRDVLCGSADFAEELRDYDRRATIVRWQAPRHRMTARVLGEGPPLIVVPGVASTYRGYCLTLNRLSTRFRTVIFDYPGDNSGDGATLSSITHDHLVDDLLALADHLDLGPAFLFGLSFGSTVTLKAIGKEPRRFPKAAIQGGFAHRKFATPERVALRLGRLVRGNVSRLPLQAPILGLKNRRHFPQPIADRWPFYLAENGLTPISALTHRLDLLAQLDLRPALKGISTEVLLIQGDEDPIVARRNFDELAEGLVGSTAELWPGVGHQPHFTHAEALAEAVGSFFLGDLEGNTPAGRGIASA
jgi:pimeloyl-ACP methyl ester carboxylesterase